MMQQNQPPIPANEDERLAALLRYHVLDAPLEKQFDDIAKPFNIEELREKLEAAIEAA